MPIQIGPIRYEINTVANLKGNDGEGLFGMCDYERQIIHLESNMRPDRAAVAKWHEVLHAIDDVYCAGIGEHGVGVLATALCQLFRDNPGEMWTAATSTPPKDGQNELVTTENSAQSPSGPPGDKETDPHHWPDAVIMPHPEQPRLWPPRHGEAQPVAPHDTDELIYTLEYWGPTSGQWDFLQNVIAQLRWYRDTREVGH